MRAPHFALALLSMAAPLNAQDFDATAAEAAYTAKKAGRYLEAAQAWRPLAFAAPGKPRPGDAYDQWREYQTRMTLERPGPPAPPIPLAPGMAARLKAATPRDATGEIVARARLTRLVILNEDHGQPRDRAFGLQVARALRPLGYRTLAVETLDANSDPVRAAAMAATLVRDGYPRQNTGYYLADPVFGDFLRQAMAIGYRPLAYEETDHERPTDGDVGRQINAREQAQATHLAAALRADPSAKILVYVGFDHVAEAPLPRDGKPLAWMAARLKAMTGIDPLTIDQVKLAEDPSFERTAGYDLAAAHATSRSKARCRW